DLVNQVSVPLRWMLAQLRKDDRIELEHQNADSRMRPSRRSKSSPSVGMARKSSAKLGAFRCSSLRRRAYSPADTMTTAGFPCFVTVCGSRRAASTTSLNRFLASWTDQLR